MASGTAISKSVNAPLTRTRMIEFKLSFKSVPNPRQTVLAMYCNE